jgi:hypothetical protein
MMEENLSSIEETIKSQMMTLKDLLRRSQWYLGLDKQSSSPTIEETANFLAEVQNYLKDLNNENS